MNVAQRIRTMRTPYLSQRVELRTLCAAEAYHALTPTDRSLVLPCKSELRMVRSSGPHDGPAVTNVLSKISMRASPSEI
jgi:hypothetical protein